MNIKLSPNAIRFRVTEAEFDELRRVGALSAQTLCPNDTRWVYEIRVHQPDTIFEPDLRLTCGPYHFELSVSPAALEDLASQPATKRSGIERELRGAHSPLKYSLEIDVRGRRKS